MVLPSSTRGVTRLIFNRSGAPACVASRRPRSRSIVWCRRASTNRPRSAAALCRCRSRRAPEGEEHRGVAREQLFAPLGPQEADRGRLILHNLDAMHCAAARLDAVRIDEVNRQASGVLCGNGNLAGELRGILGVSGERRGLHDRIGVGAEEANLRCLHRSDRFHAQREPASGKDLQVAQRAALRREVSGGAAYLAGRRTRLHGHAESRRLRYRAQSVIERLARLDTREARAHPAADRVNLPAAGRGFDEQPSASHDAAGRRAISTSSPIVDTITASIDQRLARNGLFQSARVSSGEMLCLPSSASAAMTANVAPAIFSHCRNWSCAPPRKVIVADIAVVSATSARTSEVEPHRRAS